LHLAHGAGPGPGQLGPRRKAGFQHFRDGDQLSLGPVPASPFPGKRRKRLNDVIIARNGAVGAFQPPDRNQDFRPNPEMGGDRINGRPVLGIGIAAIGDAQIRCGNIEIGPDRPHEFGLAAIAINDPHFRLEPVQHVCGGRVFHTGGDQAGPKIRAPIGETLTVRLGQGGRCEQGSGGSKYEQSTDHPFLTSTAGSRTRRGSSPAISIISLRRSASTKSSCSLLGEIKAPGPAIT
jgi:hypothetical protein